MADKQNIPKGKMNSNCRLLPEHIVCKITQRNNIRRANTCDPALKLLNEEITSDIQKHKQNIWKEHLDAHWDHRHNTHTLWKTIHGLSNRTPPHTLNTSITFNNKIATTPKHIANCFTKQFTNTVKHATHKTNRHINRATHNIQGYNITLTTSQVQEAIKQSQNNNSQGPDKLNITTLFNIYTSDLPPPGAPVQVMAYADDIHTHRYECSREIHTTIPTQNFCLDKTNQPHTKSRQNNLHSVHTRPCRFWVLP